MLNKVKVIGSYFYLYLFANLIQGNFHKGFHMPIKNFILDLSQIKSKLQDNYILWKKSG
jgi:hypothetical protein